MALSDLIRHHLLTKGNTLETVHDHQAAGVDDQIWLRKFADAGGEAIVGGDAAMTRRPHEIIAISETGLRLVILDERWARQPKHLQISYLFYWWPHIERALEVSKPGECLKVPRGWSDPKDAIKPIGVDVQAAYRKARKGSKK